MLTETAPLELAVVLVHPDHLLLWFLSLSLMPLPLLRELLFPYPTLLCLTNYLLTKTNSKEENKLLVRGKQAHMLLPL